MPISFLAHGVASRGTLPLPFWMLAWAAIFILGISFLGVSVLWNRSLLAAKVDGKVLGSFPRLSSMVFGFSRSVGLLLLFLCLGAGFFGVDDAFGNITPVTVYVVVWVGFGVFSALIGDAWKLFSPYESVAWLLDRLFPGRPVLPVPNHRWFAVLGMFGFLTLELVHPFGSSPRVLAFALTFYSLFTCLGIGIFGRGWLRSGEAFGVLFSFIAAMAPLWRDDAGRIRVRVPLSGLNRLDFETSDLALLMVVLGGTSFDGFSESELFGNIFTLDAGWGGYVPKLFILAFSIGLVWLLYFLASGFTAKVTGSTRTQAANLFGSSLVPIVLGYGLAHYAQLLLDELQRFWFLLSNPYGFVDPQTKYPASDFFGAAARTVDYTLVDVDVISWVQVLAILGGHVAGVCFAHDWGLHKFSHSVAVRSQYAMLFVMMVYSIAGLGLLFID